MAEPTYTYDPSAIATESVSRVRFELGDVAVGGGAASCFLSDEEITAVLNDDTTPRWKRKLLKLAEAVCMRLSYETDWRNDGTQFSLSQRADRWIKLRDKLEKEANIEASLPTSGAVSESIQSSDGGHYFHRGMQNSPYVQPPYPDSSEAAKR